MESSGSSDALVELFSAREFYKSCASGCASKSAGFLSPLLTIPSPIELHAASTTGAGSFAWVDGVVQQSRATQAVLNSIRTGLLPVPALRSPALSAGRSVHFCDAQSLSQSPVTLLALFCYHTGLVAAGASASRIKCRACAAEAQIFRGAHEMCSALLDAFRGRAATVSFSSRSESLKTWAEQSGFRTSQESDGSWLARIDSGNANKSFIVGLMPALQSAWRLPGLSLLAESGSTKLRLAAHGICPSCGYSFDATTVPRIESIAVRGACLSDAVSAELCLDIGGLSIQDALSTPFNADPFPSALGAMIPATFRAKLQELGLGHRPLGTLTSSLSSPELTLAVVAAALREEHGLAIIDLPQGVISQTVAVLVEKELRARASAAPTVVVGKFPAHQSHNFEHRSPEAACGGAIALLRGPRGEHPIRRGVTVLSATPELPAWELWRLPDNVELQEGASLVSLRVFDSFGSRRTTLVELLGLYEPLCRLLASSVDSRAFGLAAKDLTLRPRTRTGFACRSCDGLGVHLERLEGVSRPKASRCSTCDGARFLGGPEKLLFRGLSISQILNSTFSQSSSFLRALPRSSLVLKLVELLDLSHLPLGMPLALISFSERRRVQLLAATMDGHSPKRPQVVLVELPFAGLSEKHAHAVESIVTTPELAPQIAWVLTEQARL